MGTEANNHEDATRTDQPCMTDNVTRQPTRPVDFLKTFLDDDLVAAYCAFESSHDLEGKIVLVEVARDIEARLFRGEMRDGIFTEITARAFTQGGVVSDIFTHKVHWVIPDSGGIQDKENKKDKQEYVKGLKAFVVAHEGFMSRFRWRSNVVVFTGRTNPEPTESTCFITTAVMKALGKDDQCSELQVLRRFRDSWVEQNHPELIEEYYLIAPAIVTAIEDAAGSRVAFAWIYTEHLQPILGYIQSHRYPQACDAYKEMVRMLKHTFHTMNKDSDDTAGTSPVKLPVHRNRG